MGGLDLTCSLIAGPTTAKKRQGGTEKSGVGSMDPTNQFWLGGGHRYIIESNVERFI